MAKSREYDWAFRAPVRTDWIEPVDPREAFPEDGDRPEAAVEIEREAA